MDDRDSAHFAQATRQMLETDNYFQIRFQDITRYQKPPGINWLQALSVKAFSSPESRAVWPYRLPSVLGGWLAVLFTFAFTRRFFGRTVAWIASLSLASTALLNMESHLATIDSSLLVSVVLMQGALWFVYDKARLNSAPNNSIVQSIHWKWALLFFMSMAYGFLLKGVTPLVGFLTLLTLSFLDRTTIYFKALRWKWGLIFLLAFSAVWLTAVSLAEHSNYLMQMIQRDLLPKLAGGHESHGAPIGSHLFLLLATFWPISLFLYPACVYAWKNRTDSTVRFLFAWIIPTWIFFEFMPTKLPQYVLPTFPALAILVALAIQDKITANTRTLKILTLIWGIISLVLSGAFIGITLFFNKPISPLVIYITATLAMTCILGITFMWKAHFKKAFAVVVFGNLLGFTPVYQWFFSTLPIWSSQEVVQVIDEKIPGKIYNLKPLLSIGYEEPSLVFLLGTQAVKFWSSTPRPYQSFEYALVDNSSQPDFMTDFMNSPQNNGVIPIPLQTIKSFNYNKGRWITLTLYQLYNNNPS